MNLELLKQERVKKGFSQKQMAKELGFKDKSSYCLIENGKTQISVPLMNKIIEVLNLSTEQATKIFIAQKVQKNETNSLYL